MDEINRDYWLARAGAEIIKLVDEIVNEINSSAKYQYECKYYKTFIGLMDRTHPYNFVTIAPQKKQCLVSVKLVHQANIDGIISSEFIYDWKYKDGSYIFKFDDEFSPENFRKLKSVLRQAEAELRKDGAQSDVATESFEEKSSSGIEMVDLGLSVKWASCNLGASKPEEYGRYFAWGDVKGQTLGKKWSDGGFEECPEYDVDANDNLEPEYDAARVILGGPYRMPTYGEFEELFDNCESVGTDDYKGTGVKGRIFTSKKNGKSIFFPAAGRGGNSRSLEFAGSCGYYWSSTLYDYHDEEACYVFIPYSESVGIGIFSTHNVIYTGFSVRPVSESK